MKKRKRWMTAGLVALVLISGCLAWFYGLREEAQLDPNQVLEEPLQNMAAAKSFKYRLESTISVDNRREVISRIQGERNSSGSTHIKGEMVKTPVDIYHIDRTTYNWDDSSKKWLVISDINSNTSNVLIAELDPLSNFNFKSISQVEKVGFEKVGNRKCITIKCAPSVENELMEVALKDFRYKLWIDYKDKLIRKATLSAVSKNNPDARLNMKVEFDDYNREITIKKPDLN
ncbi:MAG: hypothetical protein GXX09_04145 [Syntrophomonadaceae bacterium]|nr:hypothetical protein [Syntrophomonadaceae bacterium]